MWNGGYKYFRPELTLKFRESGERWKQVNMRAGAGNTTQNNNAYGELSRDINADKGRNEMNIWIQLLTLIGQRCSVNRRRMPSSMMN